MFSLKKLLRAFFILPFSAGNPKNVLGGVTSHDGSITGIVFLVCTVVVLGEILIIESFGQTEKSFQLTLFSTTMTITTSVAIIICVSLVIIVTVKQNATVLNKHWDITGNIMLKCLWLFTFVVITYSAMFLVYHIACFKNNLNERNAIQSIICDCLLFIYRCVQTGFLTHLSTRVFTSTLWSYYGLLVLFLTNIAVVVIDYAEQLHNYRYYLGNATENYKLECHTNSTIGDLLEEMSFVLDPVVLEYSLLSLLFIAEIWPRKNSDRQIECLMSMDKIDCAEYINLDNEIRIDHKANHRTRMFVNISLPVLLNLPAMIIFVLKIYATKSLLVDKLLNWYNIALTSILLLVLIKCFYTIQVECVPVYKDRKLVSSDYLILVGFIGTLVYYMMRLISYVLLLPKDDTNTIKIYNYITLIVTSYFQTVFILQMKNYKMGGVNRSWLSMDYTCLFLSINNLLNWATDSFLVSKYVFSNDATTVFYGPRLWITFYSFLYPFAIFYRFKSFVAFYGLYHRLCTK